MYYEIDKDGLIVEVGIGENTLGREITEERFEEITESFRYCPEDTDKYTHCLNTNIEWVQVPFDVVQDLTDSEALSIILGGASE